MSPSNRRLRDESSPVQNDDDEPRPRKRIKLMTGQSDADRRNLRQDFRELKKEILQKQDELINPMNNAYSSLVEKNNGLNCKVAYVREAVLDADNVELISSRAAHQADTLVSIPRYDVVRLTEKLLQQCPTNKGTLDWRRLGNEAGVCFNTIPSRVTFLAGPLAADYIPKPPKPRRAVYRMNSAEEEKPEEEEMEQSNNSNRYSVVEQNIKVVSKTLTHKSKRAFANRRAQLEATAFASPENRQAAFEKLQRDGFDIDAMQYLLNPNSFTQSVENFFYFSFLIKQGLARIEVNDNKGVRVRPVDKKQGMNPDRQAVVAFTMKDWRELCREHNVVKGDIPDRSQSRVKKKSCDDDDLNRKKRSIDET